MIKETIKDWIRKSLWALHLDVTQNLRYDRQTIAIMKRVLRKNSSCIDVGCHKGEMLELMLKFSPEGKHFAFEPLPHLYQNLKQMFQNNSKIAIFDVALWNEKGTTTFNYVVNAPAYSGIKERKYDKTPEIEVITVQTEKLDNLIPVTQKIDLIKIDVEGGELGVLQGATETITRNKPFIVFESGIGASDYYDTQPKQIFSLLENCGLSVSVMQDFLKNKPPLSLSEFETQFHQQINYYFIAHPKR